MCACARRMRSVANKRASLTCEDSTPAPHSLCVHSADRGGQQVVGCRSLAARLNGPGGRRPIGAGPIAGGRWREPAAGGAGSEAVGPVARFQRPPPFNFSGPCAGKSNQSRFPVGLGRQGRGIPCEVSVDIDDAGLRSRAVLSGRVPGRCPTTPHGAQVSMRACDAPRTVKEASGVGGGVDQ